MKNKTIIIALNISILTVAMMFSGCTENQKNDDPQFIAWTITDENHQQSVLTRCSEALGANEWSTLERIAENGENYVSTVSILKLNSFTVSSKCLPIKNEYREYLLDKEQVYHYSKLVGSMMQNDQPSSAKDYSTMLGDYIQKAKSHLETVILMRNQTPTPPTQP